MSELFDLEAVRQKLAALPIETYQASETVLAEGSTTGDVLVLKAGAVEVVKDGVRLGKITEPGAVFGELSALLGEPHTADVRALERTTFHFDPVSRLPERNYKLGAYHRSAKLLIRLAKAKWVPNGPSEQLRRKLAAREGF